jgi:hypothetical protein
MGWGWEYASIRPQERAAQAKRGGELGRMDGEEDGWRRTVIVLAGFFFHLLLLLIDSTLMDIR